MAASAAVAATSSRTAKTTQVAELLTTAGGDAALVAAMLAGAVRQRRTGVGWQALRSLPAAAATPSLTVVDVDGALDALEAAAGAGSASRRRATLVALMGAATAEEQAFLRALLLGELRQGAQAAVVVDATARAAGLPLATVRRAVMLTGDVGEVAALALAGDDLASVGLAVGRAVQPMLAATAKTAAEAVAKTGLAGVETKLDGIRVQVHIRPYSRELAANPETAGPGFRELAANAGEVAVFSRSLDDLTARLPEVVAAARALPCTSAVLDGEVLALDADGRPLAFQETASQVSRQEAGSHLQVRFFDLLHLDRTDLLDSPASERWAALDALVPAGQRVVRVVTDDGPTADAALAAALAAGHEGVIVKATGSVYEAGRRGASWIKVKPVHTLDLVVLAVEWGSGRRKGWLSNLHLGCRSEEGTGFVMLGKTFKGLTDELLRWQTERFLALAEGPTDGWVVHVRPEVVVEIALDGLQTSSRYPGGVAMRFARVVRYREDKTAAEADDLTTVLRLRPGSSLSTDG